MVTNPSHTHSAHPKEETPNAPKFLHPIPARPGSRKHTACSCTRTGNLILGISGELWEQADPSGTWPGIVQIKIADAFPPHPHSSCLWQQINAGWSSQHSAEVLSPLRVGRDGLCSPQSFWGLIVFLVFFPHKKA